MQHYLPFLLEFRSRVLRYLLVLSVLTCLCCFFSNYIYVGFALPMLHRLPSGQGMLATTVTGPFLVPFKAGLFIAVVLSIPYFLFQVWQFLTPALYKHEKRWLWSVILWGTALFYIGMLFAYFFVLPLIIRFMVNVAPIGVEVRPEIGEYFSFVTQMLLAFGAAFETPIIIVFLVATGLVSLVSLKRQRSYVIVSAFIIGMLLTPPDVLSQICLAIPLWMLYELGLLLAQVVVMTKVREVVKE
ncbi:MAG: twin arginine-targeting protein translocase TatC [Gammaproteobacteria bacterium RIFCSPHIGHO2_12_FULL_41_15]|nr:MAG: twin arginine-targeting protein translocase TatC [Gammaproteobacteria bacterium RIFCSPHIGHO2_12_FULL_41_15]